MAKTTRCGCGEFWTEGGLGGNGVLQFVDFLVLVEHSAEFTVGSPPATLEACHTATHGSCSGVTRSCLHHKKNKY